MAEASLVKLGIDEEPAVLAAVIRLYLETFSAEPYNEAWTTEEVAGFFRVYCTEFAFRVQLQLGARSEIAAFGCGLRFAAWSAFEPELYADLCAEREHLDFPLESAFYIAELAVAPEHRSRRLGSQLVGQLEAIARESGHTAVLLYTAASDPRAVAFYEQKCGYAQLGIALRSDQFRKKTVLRRLIISAVRVVC